jgi:hypothetical protein
MKVAVMQPYFLPYIGYFQLMKHVDQYVIYDNIQFTKKGWIHRNRFLQNGKDELFTLPILKDSDFLDIRDRKLADEFLDLNKRQLRKIEAAYRKAPFFNEVYPKIEKCFLFMEHQNLFDFVFYSISIIRDYLKIDTPILISSIIGIDNHNLKGKDKVQYICKKLEANQYINPIGGIELYDKSDFAIQGLKLNFLKSKKIEYKQFDNEFVPWLSILDVLMFNSVDEVNEMLNQYELI